jgi:hypothetical protein
MHREPVVYCKNPSCEEPFRIPYYDPPQLRECIPDWPSDEWTVTFWCRDCGRSYEYSKSDVRWSIFQTLGPAHDRGVIAVWRIEYKCLHPGCGTSISVHIKKYPYEGETDLRKLMQNRGKCLKGHPAHGLQINELHPTAGL